MRMEALLDLYELPYDPRYPVLCFDERPCQLIGDQLVPLPVQPGKAARHDYQYERHGTCCLLIAVEPLTGFRFAQVRQQRTKADYAAFMQALVAHYPEADKIRLVQDNLNTHTAGSFYQAFEAETARQLARKFEYYYTPPHGSWLNMAEIELSALSKQCLDRRISEQAVLEREVLACVKERMEHKILITWRFTTPDARKKLSRHYQTMKNL
jgi:hypothetical protein